MAVSITTTSLPAGFANSPYSATVAATGGTTPYTWSATGLPANLTINSSTGAISGTPTAAGTSSVTVTVTDATSPTHLSASSTLSLTIGPAFSITTASLPAGSAGVDYSATVAGVGGTTPYTWSATGLPANLTINPTTGAISGVPAASGTSTVHVTLTDSTTPTHMSVSKDLTLTIGTGLAITTTFLPGGFSGFAYSTTVAATGGTLPYSWTATGLPAGVTIDAGTRHHLGRPGRNRLQLRECHGD